MFFQVYLPVANTICQHRGSLHCAQRAVPITMQVTSCGPLHLIDTDIKQSFNNMDFCYGLNMHTLEANRLISSIMSTLLLQYRVTLA